MEWLDSPIVYRQDQEFISRLRELKIRHYSLLGARYHYLQMARNNFREYLKGDEVWIKKYFYVLRPLLAIRWIDEKRAPVPTPFLEMVEGLLGSGGAVRLEILDLIKLKKAGNELGRGPKNPVIGQFIEDEFARIESVKEIPLPPHIPMEELNIFFRETVG